MAFVTDQNFRQAWSTETTIAFLRNLALLRRMNGTWDGDAQASEKVYIQNPNYNVTVTTPARKAAWGTPNEPSASRITLAMDQISRVENMLYVEDEVENAVRTYRQRLQRVSMHALSRAAEDNFVAYILALASTGAATVNGNAGPIAEIAYAGSNKQGFAPNTGKPFAGPGAIDPTVWLLQFLTDARVMFQENDIPVAGSGDGQPMTVGGSVSGMWCAMPPALYAYGLAQALENKGLSLDFTAQIIAQLGVFGTAFGGNVRGFDIFVTNSIPKAKTNSASWFVIAGANEAIAAPMRPVRNYVRDPANAAAERYEFRHAQTYGRQLANADLIVRGKFNATDGTAGSSDEDDFYAPEPDSGEWNRQMVVNPDGTTEGDISP